MRRVFEDEFIVARIRKPPRVGIKDLPGARDWGKIKEINELTPRGCSRNPIIPAHGIETLGERFII
jgi:hypothetical protein